jgi:hypothetical protein
MFAENTPDVVGPDSPRQDGRKTRTVYFAGCAWQVPVFWLFCYDLEDLSDYQCDDGSLIPTLVTPLERVRARLAERDGLARSLFPQYVSVWEEWRQAVEKLKRHYLKADMCEIWCIDGGDILKDSLTAALSWLRTGKPKHGLDDLLGVAGISTYDRKTHTFTYDEERACPERYLYGWLE